MGSWIKHRYSPVGLDLGRTAIRAVQLRRRHHVLQVHRALELGSGWSYDQASFSQEESTLKESPVISQIRRLCESGGFIGRYVTIHCPAEKLDMRPIDLPSGREGLPREAILGALRLQIDGHVPFPVEQAIFDYFPLQTGVRPGHIRVMAITADKDWIQERIRWIESAGMQCIGVDALPCVLSRLSISGNGAEAFSDAEGSSEPDSENSAKSNHPLTAVLDMGWSGSTLIVHDSQSPLFCRRFALGGREMSEILAQRLTVDFARAEQFKRRYGIDCKSRQLCLADSVADANAEPAEGNSHWDLTARRPSNSSLEQDLEIGKTIFAALQGDLRDFVEGLMRSLNYVITNCQRAQLQKIFLAGAAAHTQNLDQFLADQFELPVKIISHPLLAEITSNLPATRAQMGNWTTALGLALKQMEGTWRE